MNEVDIQPMGERCYVYIGIENCIKNVLQHSNDSSDAISLMGFLYLNQLH